MGGYGSGRAAWVYSGTVGESLQLDVNRFVREGIIRQGCRISGIITWKRFGRVVSSIGYECQCFMKNGYIRLNYTVSSLSAGNSVINYNIELFTTIPYFGGVRWWFICPNPECDRMAVKLYQSPGAKYFLCRRCQNLTYESCRESHKYDAHYGRLAGDTGLPVGRVNKAIKRIFMKNN